MFFLSDRVLSNRSRVYSIDSMVQAIRNLPFEDNVLHHPFLEKAGQSTHEEFHAVSRHLQVASRPTVGPLASLNRSNLDGFMWV